MVKAQSEDSAEPNKVWVTRAEPGAAATATRLMDMGFTPLAAPLLRMRPLEASLDLLPDDALAFTSSAGVMRTCRLTSNRDHQVFAVGDATAQAAVGAGFKNVSSATGDVAALAGLILGAGEIKRVVHPGAEETAGDLVGMLAKNGLEAITVPVYRTEAEATLPAIVAASLRSGTLAAVLVHSPKAGRIAADLLAGQTRFLGPVAVVGMSGACIGPLMALQCRRYASAASPNEADLLTTFLKTVRP